MSGRKAINPATGKALCEIAAAGPGDVDKVVKVARKAYDEGPWGTMAPADRARRLLKLAGLIETHPPELAAPESLDTGKTMFDPGKIEIPFAASLYRYYAGWADKLTGSTLPTRSSTWPTCRSRPTCCS